MNDVIDFINTHRDRYVDELKQYLAIPSISALPEHSGDVKRCAEWTAEELRRVGMENVRVIDTPGNPVVYADWVHADDAPTILFYGHYDVQPVDPIDEWESPPFEATVREGEIYARGAADDKGQIFMHFKAVEACMKQMGRLPTNIKFLLEGEEEVGSKHLDGFIGDHRGELAADVVVISDSPMFDRGVPSICYGLRGLTYFQVDLRGSKTDLHSGSFGGAVANPAFVLTQILSQMKDRGGRVKIPGFYEDVRPLRDAERAEFAKLPFNERRYRNELGAPKLFGERGYTTLERVWGRPTFEVNGLLSGFTGGRGQDRHPRGRDGQGEHAPGSRPGSKQDHPDLRGVSREDHSKDRRARGDADARWKAMDDRVRQQVRAGGWSSDREGLWKETGFQS